MARIKVNVTTTEGELLDTFWVTDEPFEGVRHDVVHLDKYDVVHLDGTSAMRYELVAYLKRSIDIVNTREQAEG